MRRLLSLVLLAAFVLPTMAPLLALGQDPDAGLPACCRRNGKHHCEMLMERLAHASRGPQVGAVCPHFPHQSVATVFSGHLIALDLLRTAPAYASALAPARRAETQRRIARERNHHKRGPPSHLLA